MEHTQTSGKSGETKNSITENHKMAATHHEEAAKCHHDAANNMKMAILKKHLTVL